MKLIIKKEIIGLLLLLIFLLVTIISYFFIIKPDVAKVNNLRLKQKNRENKLSEIKKINFKFKQKLATTDNLIKKSTIINKVLPIKMETNQFLEQIEKLTQSNDIKLISFVPQKRINKKKYTKLSIRVSFSGEYKKITYFIGNLENLDRLVTIDKLVINGVSKDILNIKSLLSIYCFQREG